MFNYEFNRIYDKFYKNKRDNETGIGGNGGGYDYL